MWRNSLGDKNGCKYISSTFTAQLLGNCWPLKDKAQKPVTQGQQPSPPRWGFGQRTQITVTGFCLKYHNAVPRVICRIKYSRKQVWDTCNAQTHVYKFCRQNDVLAKCRSQKVQAHTFPHWIILRSLMLWRLDALMLIFTREYFKTHVQFNLYFYMHLLKRAYSWDYRACRTFTQTHTFDTYIL